MKPFLSFDGEGRGGQYVLLQDSDGHILRGNPITIADALPFLFRPDRTCVWYSFSYDINMLFRDAPKQKQIELFRGVICENPNHSRKVCDRLDSHTHIKECPWKETHLGKLQHETEINGYQIELMPKKIFRIVSQIGTRHERAVHYDTIGFFQSSFLKALKDWKIPIPAIIEHGKELRDEFPTDFDIELYNLTETQLHVTLMEMLRSKIETVFEPMASGDYLSSWHGAGAIASRMLNDMETYKYSPLKPSYIFSNLEYQSYFGGRIELLKRGLILDVHNYDINSAYPAATRELPNMRQASWIKTKGTQALDYDFGVAKIAWKPIDDNAQLGPFPFRTDRIDNRKRRMVLFPMQGEGYYHLCEIKAAINRNLWNITIQNGVALDKGYEQPFWNPINEIMKKRLAYKAVNDMAHIPLKLGANSFYGKFAQRVKDKKEFGSYANYWYAGFITAWTRAELLKYAKPDATILMSTDGLYSTEKLDCPIGSNLGEWEYKHYNIGKFILPGIYKIDDTIKARGLPAAFNKDFDNLFTRILNGEKPVITEKLFIGVKRALQLHRKYPKAGFYKLQKKIDWTSVNAKRVFVDNDYSEPINPFLWRKFEQKISAGFLPWTTILTNEDFVSNEGDDFMEGIKFGE